MKLVQKRKKNNKIIVIALLLIIAWVTAFLSLNTYSRAEINQSNYKTTRLESTDYSENVEKVKEKSQSLADVIENVTKSVVGISKLKNTGNSILSKSNEKPVGTWNWYNSKFKRIYSK